jgi:cysteinyl-tRNA synthetase
LIFREGEKRRTFLLKLFNTYGKRIEVFRPVNEKSVNIFTCGPSVYQRAHIGNFRTFLFEDILIRYLEYSGYKVRRGIIFTDIEDKAIREAEERGVDIKNLTAENIQAFTQEMKLLRMKIPDYQPKASEAAQEAADIIERLLELGTAYWHEGNVYFDPLKYPGFGELYGLDMSRWPNKKWRYHKDTYPGMRWNLGDFILWHGYKNGEGIFWDTKIGRGRPSWNVQDPSMIIKHFDETLSAFCGGIDNLVRHHDYSRAILESIRPYPMARFWLHCYHLYVNGGKMSKSKGNIYYTDTVLERGYSIDEIRFFLIYSHYRRRLNYSDKNMRDAAERLRYLKKRLRAVEDIAGESDDIDRSTYEKIEKMFVENMDNDLDVKGVFDTLRDYLSEIAVDRLSEKTASGIIAAMRGVDKVLQVLFEE